MNDIRDLLPNRMRERTFQLKAKRDAGAVWHEPQFVECKQCGRRAARTLWGKSLYVCPNCGYHMPIGGYYRLSLVLDHGSFRELDADLDPQDVLNFPGYGGKTCRRPEQDRPARGCCHRCRPHWRRGLCGSRVGQPVLYGQHEHGCGREDHPRRGVRHCQAPASGHLFRPAAARGCRRAFSA